MNENAKKWVAALRSDEYQQTQGRLYDDGARPPTPEGHCCLGVGCDLYAKETGNGEWGGMVFHILDSPSTATDLLPIEVAEWLGLNTRAGKFNGGRSSLMRMNDLGRSFSEIADKIESEPTGLFREGS